MALNADALARIEAALGPSGANSQTVASLRHELPGLSLTRCDLSDMGVEEPFRRYPRFYVYLVDASEHCWRLTADPARATGLVVASKE